MAASDKVVFNKDDVFGNNEPGKFQMRSIGSGTDKQVFLTYNKLPDPQDPTKELPSRFEVKSCTDIVFDKSELVNLYDYERSIRVKDTDDPHVKNYVYDSASPGYYDVSPWLDRTQIKGKLIWEYNGYSDIEVGPNLEIGGEFVLPEFKVVPGSSETKSITKAFGPDKLVRYDAATSFPTQGQDGIIYIALDTGFKYRWDEDEYVETTDEWDGTVAKLGSITIEFSDVHGAEPKARVLDSSSSCYTMREIPDTRTGHLDASISEYTPKVTPSGKYLDVEVLDRVERRGEEGSETETTYRTLKLKAPVRLIEKKFALLQNSSYITQEGLYVKCGGSIETQYVILMKEFGGNAVGLMDYGYVSIPKHMAVGDGLPDAVHKLPDAEDKTYYETMFLEVTAREAEERGIPVEEYRATKDGDYIAHKTMGEYEWSYMGYVELRGNTGSNTPVPNSDGKDWPSSLDVLPPGQMSDEDGDVYNRAFEVQTLVYASPTPIQSSLNKMKVWIDKASMAVSICAEPNDDTWKNLIYNGSSPDPAVPPRMSDGVTKLIDKITYLDKDYFELTLTQLQTFFSMIRTELYSGFPLPESGVYKSMVEISEICNFSYMLDDVDFPNHSSTKSNWNDVDTGLFGYKRSGNTYKNCLVNFNNHLLDEFKSDWKKIEPGVSDYGADSIGNRDYHHILLDGNPNFTTAASIYDYRQDILVGNHVGGKDITGLYERINQPPTTPDDIIDEIFKDGEDETWSNKVRFINTIKTTINGGLVGMLVADDTCNLFVNSNGKIQWHTFDATKTTMDGFVESVIASDNGEYVVEPMLKFTQYPISCGDWLFKTLNRDFAATSRIQDAFAIHCKDTVAPYQDLWYVPQLNVYVYGSETTGGILDMAYEQNGDRLYVLFKGDNHLYAYDSVAQTKTFTGFVALRKETAAMKFVTFNSMCLTDDELSYDRMFLDYFKDSEEASDSYDWRIVLYGNRRHVESGSDTTTHNRETWCFKPGMDKDDFQQYNAIMFGDSLFDEGQLRFHNISKNKDMYDILDVHEIDGRYYGLFKNENDGSQIGGEDTYTVFKAEQRGGVVQRLPWQILNPHMFRTNDTLYSLYVVSNEPQDGETVHPVLREITVPDSDEYPERVIDIYKLFKEKNGEGLRDATTDPVSVMELMMDEFKLKSRDGRFFTLTNKGFHQVHYNDDRSQLSIDKMDGRDPDTDAPIGFRDRLMDTFEDIVLKKHMDEMHNDEQAYYFKVLKSKINQFADDFTVFDLIPTEFKETQDVGVIPNGPVTDVDSSEDHRDDSILTSTDILWTDGLVAQTDTNPGIVTAAVSNPATIYDDDNVFTKSQRNPSIEGTEFYDFIYDQDGNALMDLYSIPFIYRISSNNTYDLYINIPTTRTKYLNRIAGTLMDNGTNQVLPGDTRTRINFLDEMMPNNLDESTTRLQVFIDKKYISIGTVELVEISGNSIPTQIYRDVPNNGLYDSIALESKWNGKVVQIDEPSKDINKVMLEFECYGTDSQSIHIQGKTLINRALNESEYGNVQENVPSTEVKQVVLTFYPNGGSVDETTRTAIVGELFGELPTPTWEGHEFIGWFTGPGGEHLPDGVQVKEDSFVTSEMDELYAHWEESSQAGG